MACGSVLCAASRVRVPGSKFWIAKPRLRAQHSDTSQELLGKFSAFASLQDVGKVKSGIVVSITDGVTTWKKD